MLKTLTGLKRTRLAMQIAADLVNYNGCKKPTKVLFSRCFQPSYLDNLHLDS